MIPNGYLRVFLVTGSTLAILFVAAQATADTTIARVPNPPPASDLANLPGDLRAIAVPEPPNLGDFVKDPATAIALGKALFWDMQVGSDGVQACASCHFRAGADPRSKNQLSPGLKHVPDAGSHLHDRPGPNHQLTASDFPLTRSPTPGVRGALDPATDSNDAVSSQGVHHPRRAAADPLGLSASARQHAPRRAAQHAVGDQRRVQPPPVLGWARRERLQRRQPSRACAIRTPGSSAPTIPSSAGRGARRAVNSSLASQAVAPIVSDLEMARRAAPRSTWAASWPRRNAIRASGSPSVRPLAKQQVQPTDSVLGLDEPLAAAGPRRQTLRRDDQGGVPRASGGGRTRLIRVNADGSRRCCQEPGVRRSRLRRRTSTR